MAGRAVLWLSTIGSEADYLGHIAPGVFAMALGFALSFVPLTLTTVHGVQPEDSGIASALLNAAQQIGVALGLAALSTVSVTITEARLPDALTALYRDRAAGDEALVMLASDALVHGYTTGLLAGAGVLLMAAVVVIAAVTTRRTQGAAGAGVLA